MPCRAALVIIAALLAFPVVKPMSRTLSVLLLAAALVACGQKGPLYMPVKAPAPASDAPVAEAPAAEPAAATGQEQKDDEKKEKPAAAPASAPAAQP